MQKERRSIRHWTKQELEVFLECVKTFGNDFHSYTTRLARSYSQVKSHYHNWRKTLSEEEKADLPQSGPGGRHEKYRNRVQNDSEEKLETIRGSFEENTNKKLGVMECTSLVIQNYKSMQ
ncbi:SANT/Myb_domain [Hexamita inflata]|uniref:SANT/Myb domain n=1 Tax=Hexamita inflata TaxID=28002 RepID=A0AA86P3J5_9EUKA|nr:SANT/Myb domain [Hexamita inflata]